MSQTVVFRNFKAGEVHFKFHCVHAALFLHLALLSRDFLEPRFSCERENHDRDVGVDCRRRFVLGAKNRRGVIARESVHSVGGAESEKGARSPQRPRGGGARRFCISRFGRLLRIKHGDITVCTTMPHLPHASSDFVVVGV